MPDTVRFTRTQIKHAALQAHYGLFREMFAEKFPESTFIAGDGDINADIVFIGEAPGAVENKEGRPFVGKSGVYLDKLLKTVDMKRGDTFITNFMKYQPPGNRDPEGDEVTTCTYLLRNELKILNPKIVVTLGRFSTSLFFQQPHMGTLAGQMWVKRGFIVVPMFHPAAAMYDTSGSTDLLMHEHIKKVGEVFHGVAKMPLVKKLAKTSLTKRPMVKLVKGWN